MFGLAFIAGAAVVWFAIHFGLWVAVKFLALTIGFGAAILFAWELLLTRDL